ncbi:hypothetical protein KUTeg_020532 [Tegillarca granosa]|uniref:Glycosyltransferase 61 catalytic domain-containing protein n=1 Tax=Tegillarca granosa TaxID=220873 RepID=A0ABQ9EDM5_TEGGR|nr:hypothetical protein KUTeg_020532 [Tegillarca granosa]
MKISSSRVFWKKNAIKMATSKLQRKEYGMFVFSSPTSRYETSLKHIHRKAESFLASDDQSKEEFVKPNRDVNPIKLIKYNDILNKQKQFSYLDKNFKIENKYILNLIKSKSSFCDGDFEGYGNKFAHFKNILVDPNCAVGRTGGEEIDQVLNQAEGKEYLELKPSYFNIQCNTSIKYAFNSKDHLKGWMSALKTWEKPHYQDTKYTVSKPFTIAIQRYEYANLYHTMTDFYNAFLLLIIYKKHPNDTDILLIDSHPKGALDEAWDTLFGSAFRAGHLKSPVLFKDFAWGITGYYSIMNDHDLPRVPYIEEFRSFFLTQHGIPIIEDLICEKITVLFIFRRDYVAHPRNPKGIVGRKIKNEKQLLQAIEKLLPGHNVIGIQTDHYNMTEQLRYISNTDILVGMHGAGLSHTLFLPKHAGLIELYPNYWPMANRHFRAMAKWRTLHYSSWQNSNSSNELPNKYTHIPVKVVTAMVDEMYHKICGKHPT